MGQVSYQPQSWPNGSVITAQKLQQLETGMQELYDFVNSLNLNFTQFLAANAEMSVNNDRLIIKTNVSNT